MQHKDVFILTFVLLMNRYMFLINYYTCYIILIQDNDDFVNAILSHNQTTSTGHHRSTHVSVLRESCHASDIWFQMINWVEREGGAGSQRSQTERPECGVMNGGTPYK